MRYWATLVAVFVVTDVLGWMIAYRVLERYHTPFFLVIPLGVLGLQIVGIGVMSR